MKNDPVHEWTDKRIDRLEREIAREYQTAHKEVEAKYNDYMRRFKIKDATWKRWVDEGKRTPEQYEKWRTSQIFNGERWEAVKDSLANEYLKAHDKAEQIVNSGTAEIYAENYNYGTYIVEKGARVDTSFTLYNHDSVERMWREDPEIYHVPGKQAQKDIRDGKLKKWNKKAIQSVMIQGVLQGESIPQLTNRLKSVTGGDRKAAIRNARTMITGVESAGRLDAFNRAKGMGINVKKVWSATLDSRTRHWHRELDGVAVENDEYFENSVGKIFRPGDPGADGANIYNCRCTINGQLEGHETDYSDLSLRNTDHFEHMSYEEWKADKKSISHPINKQEKVGQAIKAQYIQEYQNG